MIAIYELTYISDLSIIKKEDGEKVAQIIQRDTSYDAMQGSVKTSLGQPIIGDTLGSFMDNPEHQIVIIVSQEKSSRLPKPTKIEMIGPEESVVTEKNKLQHKLNFLGYKLK